MASRILADFVRTAQQVVEAFPEDSAPRFLIRDRDQIYGEEFCQR